MTFVSSEKVEGSRQNTYKPVKLITTWDDNTYNRSMAEGVDEQVVGWEKDSNYKKKKNQQ